MLRGPTFLAGFFFLGSLPGFAVDETEPNDSVPQADDVVTETQFKTGTPINGTLTNSGALDSEDVFKVGDSSSLPLKVKASYTSAVSDPSIILSIVDENQILNSTFDPSDPIEVTVPKGSGPVYISLAINALLNVNYTITVDVESADMKKPIVRFLGKPSLGKRITRVKILCKDDHEIDRLLFRPSGQRVQVRSIGALRKRVNFRLRNRRERVRLTATAVDSSGNRGVARRTYRR